MAVVARPSASFSRLRNVRRAAWPFIIRDRIALVIFRLVLTGQDTPDKMRLLFGPHYSRERQIKGHHERIRVELLLDPPRGSPWYAQNVHLFDPSLVRSVRPANEAERRKLEKIRALQAAIQRYNDTGEDPSWEELSAESLTTPVSEIVRTHHLAEDTMDQGLSVP